MIRRADAFDIGPRGWMIRNQMSASDDADALAIVDPRGATVQGRIVSDADNGGSDTPAYEIRTRFEPSADTTCIRRECELGYSG